MLTYIWHYVDFYLQASSILVGYWKYSDILTNLSLCCILVGNFFS